MAYQVPPDIEQLVCEQMRKGSYESEDDVLREALQALAEKNEDLAAIREGIEDMEAGRMKPLSEVDAEIRRKLGLEAQEEYRQTVAAIKEGIADVEAGRVRLLRDMLHELRGSSTVKNPLQPTSPRSSDLP